LLFFFLLVEISCSIQYKYLQDEPLPLPDPRESQTAYWDCSQGCEPNGQGQARGSGRRDVQARSAFPGNAGCGGICTLNSSQLRAGKLKISVKFPKLLRYSLGLFHLARYSFAGSMVNVSLFFALGFNLSDNQLGTGFSANQPASANLSAKQHALVRCFFQSSPLFPRGARAPVLTAGGERWVRPRQACASHTFCLSPRTSPLPKHEPKDQGGTRKAPPRCWLPTPWPWLCEGRSARRDGAATGNRSSSWKSLKQTSNPHRNLLFWGWGSSAA